MCHVYYLGCDFEAPLTEPWSEQRQGFYVAEPQPHELVAVRKHLPFECVRYLGSSQGCGCGFRHATNGYIDPDSPEPPEHQADHLALVAYLRRLPRMGRSPQIYGCWSGDEGLPCEDTRTCAVDELAAPDFQFRSRERITIVMDEAR